MKIKKFNEEILNKINYKDMNNWSIDSNKFYKEAKTGKKEIDEKLGEKVFLLFEKYDILPQIDSDKYRMNFLNSKDLLFPDEENFDEYRIGLYDIIKFEDWCDSNAYDIKDMSEEEIDELEGEYAKSDDKIDDIRNAEFSVFLPENVNNVLYAALFDASMYLKFLNNTEPETIKGYLEYHTMLTDDIENLKKVLDIKNVEITNNNINLLQTLSYRIYKDSKFFGEFYNETGDNNIQLFRDWLKLIGEKPNF